MATLKNAAKWTGWVVAVVLLNAVLPYGLGLVASFALTARMCK